MVGFERSQSKHVERSMSQFLATFFLLDRMPEKRFHLERVLKAVSSVLSTVISGVVFSRAMKFLSHPTLDNFDIGSSKGHISKNSWVASAGLIAAAMAGAGVVCES